MHRDVLQTSIELKNRFFDQKLAESQFSVFLCGGASEKNKEVRKRVGAHIEGKRSKFEYTVHYPENMFIDLILGHQKRDLLTLETLLASSVHAVVLLLQSPGTFTELGAFANFDGLKDKLIVLTDREYRKERSFINLGPLRYLKTKSDSRVLYVDLSLKNAEALADQIVIATREITRKSPPKWDLSNPIASYMFYLAMIYVFEPITKEDLAGIIWETGGSGKEDVFLVMDTVLYALMSTRCISSLGGAFITSQQGREKLMGSRKARKRNREIYTYLTNLRISAINATYRKPHWNRGERAIS